MSRKTTRAPVGVSPSLIGVVVYSTGKLVPSLRQKTSSQTVCGTPCSRPPVHGQSSSRVGGPVLARVVDELVMAPAERLLERIAGQAVAAGLTNVMRPSRSSP